MVLTVNLANRVEEGTYVVLPWEVGTHLSFIF